MPLFFLSTFTLNTNLLCFINKINKNKKKKVKNVGFSVLKRETKSNSNVNGYLYIFVSFPAIEQ